MASTQNTLCVTKPRFTSAYFFPSTSSHFSFYRFQSFILTFCFSQIVIFGPELYEDCLCCYPVTRFWRSACQIGCILLCRNAILIDSVLTLVRKQSTTALFPYSICLLLLLWMYDYSICLLLSTSDREEYITKTDMGQWSYTLVSGRHFDILLVTLNPSQVSVESGCIPLSLMLCVVLGPRIPKKHSEGHDVMGL